MLLSAREAAELLGIKLDTLYAYVSRGQLTSIEVAASRERHYDAAEVERFRVGRGARGRVEALTPVIASAICLIENHRLYYRGNDALALAETASLEDVAAILWDGDGAAGRADAWFDASPPAAGGAAPAPAPSLIPASGATARNVALMERCAVRLAELGAADLAALDLSPAGLGRTGRTVLRELAAAVGGGQPTADAVHRQLAANWRLEAPGADLLRRCLVLLADHELNASTFVARCIASTGATLYAAVAGALAALSGRRHGGQSGQAEALCRELAEGGDPLAVMAARLARGEDLPGLGQPLYPDGDPRAAAILDAAKSAVPDRAEWIAAMAQAAVRLTGHRPNVDFALGLTAALLGLPSGAALGIFLVARSVGWIAHAMEQYQTGLLIRPRARYIGKRPHAAIIG